MNFLEAIGAFVLFFLIVGCALYAAGVLKIEASFEEDEK